MCAQITPFGVASAATKATTFAEHIGGSRAPTVASDCDAASLAFQNVCFLRIWRKPTTTG
jgi:hypothetical protein